MEKRIQTMAEHWFIRPLIICFLMMTMSSQVRGSDWTNIITPKTAISNGAVCLDGSPATYYFRNGSGDGIDNWLIYLEGGGWCTSNKGCLERTKIYTGTSTLKPKRMYFTDILSEDQTINPDFYNWNRVFVAYCDSSSYLGDVEANTYPNRRGARIFDSVMEDLLDKGMKNAKNAILSGGSAGGLGTILHCDGFRSLIPKASRVKCLSDAGFFIHAKNLHGAQERERFFANMIAYHGATKHLPASCTTKMNANLLREHYFSNDPTWTNCISNLKVCTPTQLQTMKDFRTALIKTLREVANSPSTGILVHSCYRHGHFMDQGWCTTSPALRKKINQAIADWYFDRRSFQEIDTHTESPRNCTKLT
ncbi:pectin acetylesterase 11-like isoform X2 [Sesamum indicum]|uniref:Pectin acetylesterase n=1 Tax=Sesamum indicum TaxID=4182 RepID=A0A8M8UW17_SESIN|nr:pectin acetylesterase 11-like isoform X2 [Sesamum indicum]